MKMKATLIFIFNLAFSATILGNSLIEIGGKLDDDSKLTKEVSKGFKVKPDVMVDLINKYGQITVNDWDKDSVGIRVIITVTGKTESDVQKQMERIDFDFKQTLNFLTIETLFESKSSFAKEILSALTESSKSISGKSKVSVDYELFVPNRSHITITNKFGDIYLGDHYGKLKVDLMHGDLRANSISSFADLSVGFGRIKIKQLKAAKIVLRGAALDLESVQKLELASSTSDIKIGTVDNLILDTRNDILKFESINIAKGKAYFADLKINTLVQSANLEAFYGGILIDHIEDKISSINITAKSANVSLTFGLNCTIDCTLSGKEDKVFLPAEFSNLIRAFSDSNNRNVILTGKYGYSEKVSPVNIDVENGDLVIYLSSPVPISNNKR
jgi:hypothetical protein